MELIKLILMFAAPFIVGCGLTVERKWMPMGDGSRGIYYDRVSSGGFTDASNNNIRAYGATFENPIPLDQTPEQAQAKLQKIETLPTTVATQEGWVNRFTGSVLNTATGAGIGGYFAKKAAEALRPDQTNISGVGGASTTTVDVSQDQNQKGLGGQGGQGGQGGHGGSGGVARVEKGAVAPNIVNVNKPVNQGGTGGVAVVKDSGNSQNDIGINLNQKQNQNTPPCSWCSQ